MKYLQYTLESVTAYYDTAGLHWTATADDTHWICSEGEGNVSSGIIDKMICKRILFD